MTWLEAICSSIAFMEEHLTDDITANDIAKAACISTIYFQKGFAILCDMSVSEYLRNRRLSLAGRDLRIDGCKVIDVAMKYGYESPDSFTKAFTRFHGITPNQAKSGDGELKNFLPLRLQVSMKGGFDMEVKILKKSAFTVVGSSKIIGGDKGFLECPKFWEEHYAKGDGKYISGVYGICIDDPSEGVPMEEKAYDKQKMESMNSFKYLIADDYKPSLEYPERFVTEVIPENTWAVFPCKGPMPSAMQNVYQQIFKEWLPNNPDYEVAGMYNIERYTNASDYPKGNQDENYLSEIWIPVKAK